MRPDWDDYWFTLAATVATRATCPRASIGAVLVRDKKIIGTGFNGNPPGEAHCPQTAEHLAIDHCRTSRHAEDNVLRNAMLPAYGGTLYVVGPRTVCPTCADKLRQAGVTDIRHRWTVPTLDSVIREVNTWQAATFPHATPASVVEHLRREVNELADDPTDLSELADVVILAAALSLTLCVDLKTIVAEKLAINRARTWGEPDHLGVVEHVRQEAPA
jgi:dCMP deaminase